VSSAEHNTEEYQPTVSLTGFTFGSEERGCGKPSCATADELREVMAHLDAGAVDQARAILNRLTAKR
jgi:hypothetical protein